MCKECGCGLTTALTCPICGGNMVLVDGEAMCVVCESSPAHEHPHDHPHDHAHGHSHELTEHTHVPTAVHASSDDQVKLLRLLPYWIEHNQEHAESFQRWAATAQALGQQAVAERLSNAAAQIQACNEELGAALALLK